MTAGRAAPCLPWHRLRFPLSAGRLALLVAVVLLLGVSGREYYSADGLALQQVAQNLLAGHGPVLTDTVALEPFGHWHDGRLYAKFGVGQSLLLMPYIIAGRFLGVLTGFAAAERIVVSCFNTGVVALIAYYFWWLVQGLGRPDRVRRDLTLLLVFTTPLWVYAKQDFPEPLCALLLLVALDAMLRGRHWRAGLVLGAAALVRHDLALLAGLWLLLPPAGAGWRSRARFMLGLLPGAVLALGYNYARYGALLTTGFGDADEKFSTPLLLGLGGLLFSPGKSLFIYAPVLILLPAAWLALRRIRAQLAWSLLLMVVGYIVLHALWYAWMGGWCWGPRRLVPLLPLLMLPLAVWDDGKPHRLRLLFVFALCGLLVNFAGVAVNFSDYLSTDYYRIDTIFTAANSPVAWHWRHILTNGNDFLWSGSAALSALWVMFGLAALLGIARTGR